MEIRGKRKLPAGDRHEQRDAVAGAEREVLAVVVEGAVEVELVLLLEPVRAGPDDGAFQGGHLFPEGGNHRGHAGIVPDERHRNISVDSVRLTENPVPFTLTGPLLRVELPQPMTVPFDLRIDYHGIVPQHAETGDAGGLAGLMGTSGIDLGSLLGGVGESSGRPRHTDYGLYTYSGGMLSLGSYWYPQLAVRKAGRWIDELPQGAGDIGFSEAGDFEVRLTVPQGVVVAATGQADERSRRQCSRHPGGKKDGAHDHHASSQPAADAGINDS